MGICRSRGEPLEDAKYRINTTFVLLWPFAGSLVRHTFGVTCSIVGINIPRTNIFKKEW